LFSPVSPKISDVWTRDIFESVFKTHANELKTPQDYVNHSLYFEAKTFLHGLLMVEDKLSMAYGLETRVPFLDNDLVDFAMKLPVNFKLQNPTSKFRINENEQTNKVEKYMENVNDGKYLLRQSMGRHLPPTVTRNPKQGFSAPDETWFRGKSINFVKNLLTTKESKLYDFFDYDFTQTLLSEHFEGQKNRRLFIWSLLSLHIYLDIHCEGT
jgi:asparagine synthase (glutamine-hydrolysing)